MTAVVYISKWIEEYGVYPVYKLLSEYAVVLMSRFGVDNLRKFILDDDVLYIDVKGHQDRVIENEVVETLNRSVGFLMANRNLRYMHDDKIKHVYIIPTHNPKKTLYISMIIHDVDYIRVDNSEVDVVMENGILRLRGEKLYTAREIENYLWLRDYAVKVDDEEVRYEEV